VIPVPSAASPGPISVYVVEDDQETQARFAEAIAASPRTRLAGAASFGRGAIAELARCAPDVLLVDLGLPDIPGIEVIRYAAEHLPACDIMVVTVFGDEAHVLGSIEAGATGYVLKDCTDAELIGHVVELRAGGSPISPLIARRLLSRMRGAGPAPGRDPAGPAAPVPLSERECEVLRLISNGHSYQEAAAALRISGNTVRSHVKNVYRKLAVNSAAAAVRRAAELGLLFPGRPR
jgi:DNA-binding NarL/FixJ family response regulator